MHIVLRDEVTGKIEGIVCVDRETQMCTILHASAERLDDLTRIALAMKVPSVLALVPSEAADELESYGWTRATELVLMRKMGATNGKGT